MSVASDTPVPARRRALDGGRRVLTAPTVGPFLALVLAMAFFTVKSDRFLHAQNLSLVLQQVMVVGVLAIGQTLVILTAGIDLSCGTVMALGQIVMTKLAVANGVPALPAIALGILTCVAFGLLKGGLVVGIRLPAFIVTLGTQNIAFALTHIVSDDLTFSGLPSAMLFFGRTFSFAGADFTYGVVLMLLLYAVVWFALTQTAWGRHVYAVGTTARRPGSPASGRRACCSASTRSRASRTGSRRCCSSRGPSSATRTRARRPRTSTPSPPSSSAARACSAAAAR